MYLKRLELTGFKSFAQKTILEFPRQSKTSPNITAIVGANGSGKTNLSDAVRWVLGEQSIKTLRGKKSEDIIFIGKDRKMNLAEVSIFFNNEDGGAPIDYQEFTITRRIWRSGESEYLINNAKVRLADILILLAQANFGQKSYSIVGQGLTDAILAASPLERKKFFDEATGVKVYQIKRDEALRKIEKSQFNLHEAEIALNEIEPRVRSLSRQIKKLERRKELETRLRSLQERHYRKIWCQFASQIHNIRTRINKKLEAQSETEEELTTLEKQAEKLTYEEPDKSFQSLQGQYQKLLERRSEFLEKKAHLEAKLTIQEERALQRAEIKLAIPLEKIHSRLKRIEGILEELLQSLSTARRLEELNKIKALAAEVAKKIQELLGFFGQSASQLETGPSEKEALKELEEKIKDFDKKIALLREAQKEFSQKERLVREKLLEFQKKTRIKQSELNAVRNEVSEMKIELVRLETKEDGLKEEIKNEMSISIEEFSKSASVPSEATADAQFANKIKDFEQIGKLKRQLELIGGIDPEVTREYPEIRDRYEFLNSQSKDLKKSIESLKKIIAELDEKIINQFRQSFSKINEEFDKYFKIFLGRGKAHLELEKFEAGQDMEEDESTAKFMPEAWPQRLSVSDGGQASISGIDIRVTLPGKKIKSVETLSGGERALTSLALVSAIIAINKPPFVVLDEADASLDEENSLRFVKILNQLAKNIQFIIITHNRQTMEAANILYGVNMGPDGISRLVSLRLSPG